MVGNRFADRCKLEHGKRHDCRRTDHGGQAQKNARSRSPAQYEVMAYLPEFAGTNSGKMQKAVPIRPITSIIGLDVNDGSGKALPTPINSIKATAVCGISTP